MFHGRPATDSAYQTAGLVAGTPIRRPRGLSDPPPMCRSVSGSGQGVALLGISTLGSHMAVSGQPW
jgi:hypothetical protein